MNVVSMSKLGRKGRFGNQIFQYMFLRTYARRHGARTMCPLWVGNYLFGTDDPPVTQRLPVIKEKDEHTIEDTVIPHARQPFLNCDFEGYFQYHTSYYAPDRDFIRQLFRPVGVAAHCVQAGWDWTEGMGRTCVGVHVRRGDYGKKGFFWRTPVAWFRAELERLWPDLERPWLYVATDEPAVVDEFEGFPRVSAAHCPDGLPENAKFYMDFYALTQADVLLIPNSTFSFAAAMLNERLKFAKRSWLCDQSFHYFEPWYDLPLRQQDRLEDYPHIPAIRWAEAG